jgi:RHS repeat-associated protein
LKDLYSVDALVNNRGHEVERVTYDAYGLPLMKSIHVADVDYSGTVNATDTAAVVANYGLSVGTVGPIYDIDGNGAINATDSGLVSAAYGSAIGTARVSSVGNPYLFTGRRMHFFETEFTGLGPEANTPIQYNRARHYDPQHGRWLQRDPAEYVDGMNQYEYLGSQPTVLLDPLGLRDADTHEERTSAWAISAGMRGEAARLVGEENIATDGGTFGGGGTGWHPTRGDQSRHFNSTNAPAYSAQDSRSAWMNRELRDAEEACSKDKDEPATAARHLGRAIHSAQDWWAHGDYFAGKLPIGYSNRHGGPSDFGVYYDVWNYDAATTSDGRAPQVFDPITGMEIRYTNWIVGNKRNTGVRNITQGKTRAFLRFIDSPRAGCECRRFFLR